jgi:hypothetical protein
MRYLTLGEVMALHRAILESSGGASGIRDLGALESALAQPRASLSGVSRRRSLTPEWDSRSPTDPTELDILAIHRLINTRLPE